MRGGLKRRVERGVEVDAVAAPDAVGLEARRAERHPAALLEAAVGLGLRRRTASSTLTSPPSNDHQPSDVGHVLPAELEAEQPVQEAPPLDVGVHEVDQLPCDEPGHEAAEVAWASTSSRARDAVVGVVAEARAEGERRAPWGRPAGASSRS